MNKSYRRFKSKIQWDEGAKDPMMVYDKTGMLFTVQFTSPLITKPCKQILKKHIKIAIEQMDILRSKPRKLKPLKSRLLTAGILKEAPVSEVEDFEENEESEAWYQQRLHD